MSLTTLAATPAVSPYQQMLNAERAFTNALERRFGAAAVCFRYDLTRRLLWTPEIHQLASARQQAIDHWRSGQTRAL